MPKKKYENMWHELKSNVERNIISVYPEVNEHVPDYQAGQYNILEELGADRRFRRQLRYTKHY